MASAQRSRARSRGWPPLGGRQRQERPHALAAAEQRVAQRRRRARRGVAVGMAPAQARVDAPPACASSQRRRRRGARALGQRASASVVERRRGRADVAALGEDLDAALGVLEPRVAERATARRRARTGQRLLEREVAVARALHNRLELGDGGFEIVERVGHRHRASPGAPPPRPRARSRCRRAGRARGVTCTVSPSRVDAASRRTRPPVGREAHGVAAAEHRERAERVEPAGERAEPRARRGGAGPRRRRRAVAPHRRGGARRRASRRR